MSFSGPVGWKSSLWVYSEVGNAYFQFCSPCGTRGSLFWRGSLILRVGRIHPLQDSLCWVENHLQCRQNLCAQSGEEPRAKTLPGAGHWPWQLLGPVTFSLACCWATSCCVSPCWDPGTGDHRCLTLVFSASCSPSTAPMLVTAPWAPRPPQTWSSHRSSQPRVTSWGISSTWTWGPPWMCPKCPPSRWVLWTSWEEGWTAW